MKTKKSKSYDSEAESSVLREVMDHYNMWTEDNEQRRTRKNGWNDITDAYWGKLPSDWPYLTKVVDPRIRTSLIEKNARLLNSKLRGRLVPREGGDVIKARINNALLDFQWDNANFGGTMLDKWGTADMDTRLYGSKFAFVPWKHEVDDEGNVLFSGNEFIPKDIRDCGLDPSSDHIRNAKWFQCREWAKMEDLENVNETSDDEPMFPGLNKLKEYMSERKSDRRDNAYSNRILELKGLNDRVGDDKSFPIVELVTEYRKDRWITFSPAYKCVLRDIPNPYKHKKIPFIQLRYYSIQGDPLGESEVEPVIQLWKAIQATLCGYLDNMNMHMRPPIKIIEGATRIETIVYGPEAQWIVDRQDAVEEMRSNGEAMSYFQTTSQHLISCFNTAMGDTSMGVSAVDPTANRRTATEIKKSSQQQLSRDQKNQASLGDALQDMMSMWLSNNQQFLFNDAEKKEYILRIVGSDLFNYFQRAGFDEEDVPIEGMQTLGDLINEHGGNLSDDDIKEFYESGKVPKYPVFDNPDEKNPEKLTYKPKMRINDMNDGAELSVVPEDLEGVYDYVPSVRSMAAGAEEDLINGIQKGLEMITNPTSLQLLKEEGYKPNVKELFIDSMEYGGLKDAERYFSKIEMQPEPQGNPMDVLNQDPNAMPQEGMPPQMDQSMPNMQQMDQMPIDGSQQFGNMMG